ncbi:MAG: hypothetical protein WCO82_12225, partial [Sphingomonadales bacterium]
GSGELEALLHTAFRLQLGHFGLLFKDASKTAMAAHVRQAVWSCEAARIATGRGGCKGQRDTRTARRKRIDATARLIHAMFA